MAKRITIMMDDDMDKLLRIKQAKVIKKYQTAYSYSRAVNDTLRKELT